MICYLTVAFIFSSSVLINNPTRKTTFKGCEDISTERLIIDLNIASKEDLRVINGIGDATAQAIVAYREECGGFTALEQIMDIHGIGDKKVAAWREFICIS